MEKFIPYEKLSKKEKRKIDSKAYNRNKARIWKRDYQRTSSGNFLLHSVPFSDILAENTRQPQKLFFDDLGEGFVPKLSFGKFGILSVLRTFQKEKLGAKTQPNRKRGVLEVPTQEVTYERRKEIHSGCG